MLELNVFSLKNYKSLFFPEMRPEEIQEMETNNLWTLYRVSAIVSVIEVYILVFACILYRDDLVEKLGGMISVSLCLGMCLFVQLLTRSWKSMGQVNAKRVRTMAFCFYWLMSFWGMYGSYRHYILGEQMLIFDTVQLCFALFVTTHPLHALLRVVGSYGFFYYVLYQWDAGAGIQGLNYLALMALLFSGYVIHFRRELGYIRLQVAQRNQIADLEITSNHDALTGLKNRRALRQDFPSFVGKTVWVIMADIDYFKRYNDTYGHGVGDQLLVAISQEIREVFGQRTTYRFGGDEFLIIVEREDRAEVWPLLVEWEKRISEIRISTAIETVTPRCSFGLSGGWMKDEAAVREQMRLADEKLYEVKNARTR